MKEFPMRGHDLKPKRDTNKLYDICQCGHGWHEHQLLHISHTTQCEICVCPIYIYERKMTMHDYIDHTIYLRMNNRGFST